MSSSKRVKQGIEYCRVIDFIRLAEAHELGSLHEAAANSSDEASAAAYSRSILSLETNTGLSLSQAEQRNFKATEDGKRLISITNPFIDKIKDLVTFGQTLQDKVTIYAGDSITRWLLLPLLRKINKLLHIDHPEKMIRITTATSNESVNAVLNHTADFGVCRTEVAPEQLTFFHKEPLGSSNYALICSRDLANRHGLKLTKDSSRAVASTLHKLMFSHSIATIGGSGGFATSVRKGFEAYAQDDDFGKHNKGHLEFTHFEHIIYAVQSDDIFGIVPTFQALQHNKDLAWSPCSDLIKGYSRKLSLIGNENNLDNKGLTNFASEVGNLINTRVEELYSREILDDQIDAPPNK